MHANISCFTVHIIDASVGHVSISDVYGLVTTKFGINVGLWTLISGKILGFGYHGNSCHDINSQGFFIPKKLQKGHIITILQQPDRILLHGHRTLCPGDFNIIWELLITFTDVPERKSTFNLQYDHDCTLSPM